MHAQLRKGVLNTGLALVCALPWIGWYLTVKNTPSVHPQARADFGLVKVPADVRYTANWALAMGDNEMKDFIVIDKRSAQLYVLDRFGRLRGFAPVLLGAALGDISSPGIGRVAIADVKPAQRVTPAGRFVAERGHNLRGEDVVWLDYDAAVSIHRVITSNHSERRLDRLDSPSPDDNRISYGCINVAPKFYEDYIRPLFESGRAVIYVIPEQSAVQGFFPTRALDN